MMDRVPPVLRRKLRAYRLAYAAVSLLETLAVATLLTATTGGRSALLALGWLIWRAARWPADYAIARRFEQQHPESGEVLTAAVQLAQARDAEPLQGSPALRGEVYAEADRHAAPLAAARLVSWRPAIAVGTAAVVALLVLHRPPVPQSPVGNLPGPEDPAVSPLPTDSDPATVAPTIHLAELQVRLAELSRQLRALPEHLRRALPAHGRTLEQARDAARRAEAALARGDTAEASLLTDTAAELLAEFSRLAQALPELASLAASAGQLANGYAAWGRPLTEQANAQPITPSGIAVRPGMTNTTVRMPTTAPAPAGLPDRSTGVAWDGGQGGEPAATSLGVNPVAGYEQATRDYFERLANKRDRR